MGLRTIAALLLILPAWLPAKAPKRAAHAKRAKAKPAAAAATAADLGLVDFSLQPFSDQASHLSVLRKPGEGFASFDLDSAAAFGSLAAGPHAAKKLLNIRVELEVAGKAEAVFPKSSSCSAEDYPRYCELKAAESGLQAQAVLLYPETDAMLLLANVTNRSRATVKIRPRLVLSGGQDGVDSEAKLDSKSGVLSLTLDRSKLVSARLKETLCVMAGQGKSTAIFSAASMRAAENLGDAPQVGLGGFTLTLAPQPFSTLKPGQALRFPVAISLALDEKAARPPMSRLWTRWALPKGEALGKAKARWNLSSARLPKPVDAKQERVSRAAALTLLMNQYARRGELRNDMISQAKGSRDAFFSDGMPMAALGYAELDLGLAEAALLELSSFSAAAPAPVPPHTGEGLMLWDAAGLPLHALAAWELYQRDPELGRAGDFLKAMGVHLRNECAWWPSHRDGDGNGLYAYATAEERPAYLGAMAPGELPGYSVALSALLSWQMQAASGLASLAGEKSEADKLLAESQHISASLKRSTRSPQGVYEQGLDGYFPYLLGLDQDLAQARFALAGLTASVQADALPFVENGVFHPWRAYWMLRCLSLFGEQESARLAAGKILAFMEGKGFFSAYSPSGAGLGSPGDSASAAAALEMALQRDEQEAYLLADTKAIHARLLQLRSLDGNFYLKRAGLSESKAPYELIHIVSLHGGPILEEGGFVLSADGDIRLSLISQWGLDLSEEKSKRELFKATKRADWIVKAKVRYLVKIIK